MKDTDITTLLTVLLTDLAPSNFSSFQLDVLESLSFPINVLDLSRICLGVEKTSLLDYIN